MDDGAALVTVATVAALAGAVWRIRHPARADPTGPPSGRRGHRGAAKGRDPAKGAGGRIAKGAAAGAGKSFGRILRGR